MSVSSDHRILLNIGGTSFTTTTYFASIYMFRTHTVITYRGTVKETNILKIALADESTDSAQVEQVQVFVDRDPKHFQVILNYLRTGGVLTDGMDSLSLKEVAIEAEFYGLSRLKEECIKRQRQQTSTGSRAISRILQSLVAMSMRVTTWLARLISYFVVKRYGKQVSSVMKPILIRFLKRQYRTYMTHFIEHEHHWRLLLEMIKQGMQRIR